MFSNFPIAQPVSKPIIASPFFMFLSNQQKATKAQNPDIKLLDLASSSVKEWDQVTSIQDEYTAKFLDELEKIQAGSISDPLASLPPQPEIKIAFDAQGNPMPPRRPLTAFFIFKEHSFAQVKRENPTLKVTDLTKIIAARWRELDQKTKEYYECKNVEAKALYEKQLVLFEATYGKIQRKTRTRVTPGGSSLFQMNHPNPADNSDSD